MPLTWTHSPTNDRIFHQNSKELEVIITTCI
jgi:hypothetical protein